MVVALTCGNCGLILSEDFGTAEGSRRPCPNCQSRIRGVYEYPLVTVKLDVSVFDQMPTLLLKTVIDFAERTDEGHIIAAVCLPWFDILQELSRDPTLMYEIHHRKWEEIIAGAYEREGYDEVILTPPSADGGRDVIAVKSGVIRLRVIDQVKAYKPGHLVTAEEARALYGVMELDKAFKAFLTTTSDFAPRLREDALLRTVVPDRLELRNGKQVLEHLKSLS